LEAASAELVAVGAAGLAETMCTLLPPVDAAVITGDVGEFLYAWIAGGQRTGYEGWLDDDLAFTRGWGFELGRIRVPVLLAQGRHDLMVPFAHGGWLATQVPNAEAHFTDEDGHLTLITTLGPVHEWLRRQ